MKSLLIAFFTMAGYLCSAQVDLINQSLTDTSLNILYTWIDNRIKVTGKSNPYTIAVAGTGGVVYKDKERENEFIVKVDNSTGYSDLVLLLPGKIVLKKKFEIRTLSKPIATIGGFNDTTVKANILVINPHISVVLPGCFYKSNYRVSSFKAAFIHDTDSVFTEQSGYSLSAEQIRLIKTLPSGDKISFDQIYAVGPEGKRQHLSSFWIKIE